MAMLVLMMMYTFFIYKLASTETSLYNEMRELNASCYPADTCSTFRYSKNDHLWGGRVCECGPHCVRFGTCCADSAYIGKRYSLPLPRHEHCQVLENFPLPVMMVSKCADGHSWSPEVVRKCEKTDHSSGDRLLRSIPLTNTKTLTTYKNYFCALCNDGGKKFRHWSVRLRTKHRKQIRKSLRRYRKTYFLNHVVYDGNRKSWVFVGKNKKKLYEVSVRYVLLPYLRKMVKRCYVDAVQTCNSSYSKSELESKCQSYYSPVKVKNDKGITVYRNVHCTQCNDVEMSSILRKDCRMALSKRADELDKSFSVLLDTNTRHGSKIGIIQSSVARIDCGINGIYDPYFKKCRQKVCAPGLGLVLVDGKCVRKQ